MSCLVLTGTVSLDPKNKKSVFSFVMNCVILLHLFSETINGIVKSGQEEAFHITAEMPNLYFILKKLLYSTCLKLDGYRLRDIR